MICKLQLQKITGFCNRYAKQKKLTKYWNGEIIEKEHSVQTCHDYSLIGAAFLFLKAQHKRLLGLKPTSEHSSPKDLFEYWK